MECLPSDIELDILSRLPVESVLDCKLVCKRLLNLLNHQWDQFAKLHHQHQLLQLASSGDAYSATGLLLSLEEREKYNTTGIRLYYGDKYNYEMNIIHDHFSYKTLQETSVSFPYIIGWDAIVGSCNGLICLNRYHHTIYDPIHICNPNTGEYVNLPAYTLREEKYYSVFGFGYAHSITSDQYKVVRIYYPGSEDYQKGEVQVYTIGSGSGWRTIGTTSYQLFAPISRGIFVDGSLHWIDGLKIVDFNLAYEEFRLIQLPPCQDFFGNCFYSLQSFRGNLCFCLHRKEEHLLDIWSLKKNTTEVSWSRDFSIAYSSGYEFPAVPLLITKKSEVLFLQEDVTLCCHDPKTNTMIKLWDDDEKSEVTWLTAVPHMNSFVSLKALGERCESKKKVKERSFEGTD